MATESLSGVLDYPRVVEALRSAGWFVQDG